jgi:hypothetical protein
VVFGLPWPVVGEAPGLQGAGGARLRSRPSSVDRTGRAIVLMPGPYDSCGKKVNEVNMYDVFACSEKPLSESPREYLLRAGHRDPKARVPGFSNPTGPIACALDREGMGFVLQYVTPAYVAGSWYPEPSGASSGTITTDSSSDGWGSAGARTPGAWWAAPRLPAGGRMSLSAWMTHG